LPLIRKGGKLFAETAGTDEPVGSAEQGVCGVYCGLLPEIWSSFSESIIDKFSMLLTLNLGGYTYAEALQWATDCG
jgi:hypothetical protein